LLNKKNSSLGPTVGRRGDVGPLPARPARGRLTRDPGRRSPRPLPGQQPTPCIPHPFLRHKIFISNKDSDTTLIDTMCYEDGGFYSTAVWKLDYLPKCIQKLLYSERRHGYTRALTCLLAIRNLDDDVLLSTYPKLWCISIADQ
jgi:hypothetical protein